MSEPTVRTQTAALTTGVVRHDHPIPVLGTLGLFTVLIGAALPLIDFFIVNVALPTIDKDLAAGPALLELVVAGYGLAYAVLLVLGGRLGDMAGRRRLFLTGMAAFALTSLACGLAPDAWTLVGARVAQGASAALMLPQVLATIQAATSGHRRARAMSLYGATAGLDGRRPDPRRRTGRRRSAVVGVRRECGLAVGLPGERAGGGGGAGPGRACGAGDPLGPARAHRRTGDAAAGRFAGDAAGAADGGTGRGLAGVDLDLLALFPIAAAAFYRVEQRADRRGQIPLIPPSLLRLDSLRRGLALVLPFSLGFGGFMFVIAVALQQGLKMGPAAAGLALAPMAVAFFAASLAGPRLVRRFGSRVVTAGGLIQGAGVTVLALTVWLGWPDLGLPALLPGVAIAGLGQGLQLPVLFRIVLSDVPAERAGVGGGVMTTTQQAALALGWPPSGRCSSPWSPVRACGTH